MDHQSGGIYSNNAEGVADSNPAEGHSNSGGARSSAPPLHEILQRRLRRNMLGPSVYDGAPWDVLLDLFLAHEERREISLTCLGLTGSIPETTALRWIKRLSADGIILKYPDPGDARRTLVRLAPATIAKIRSYFDEVDRRTSRAQEIQAAFPASVRA